MEMFQPMISVARGVSAYTVAQENYKLLSIVVSVLRKLEWCKVPQYMNTSEAERFQFLVQ